MKIRPFMFITFLIISNYTFYEFEYPSEVTRGIDALADPRISYSDFLYAKDYYHDTLEADIEFEHLYPYTRSDYHSTKIYGSARLLYYEVFASYGYCSPERIEGDDCCSKYFSKKKGEENPNGWILIDYGRSSAGPNIALFSDEKNTYTIHKSDLFKKVVIAFPGTKEPSQLVGEVISSYMIPPNFKSLKKGIKINQYIDKRTSALIDIIFSKNNIDLMSLIDGYQVILTGHSLGGAMAAATLLYAIDRGYLTKDLNKPVLITYGQHRTGNEQFALAVNKYAEVIYRNVNEKDVVPQIPLYVGGYRHPGGEIFIEGDKNNWRIKSIEEYNNEKTNDFQRFDVIQIIAYLTQNLDSHLYYYGKELSNICG